MKALAKILIVTISLLTGCISSFAQSFLISEYFNASSPTQEWTEIIVNEDNSSLVGCVLRDNSSSGGIPNKWVGGIRFRDIEMWKHLRAGTIIVINHRGTVVQDDDKSDGYIETSAECSLYFDEVCFSCDSSNWRFEALSIAQTTDIIELLSSAGTHIHSLSHITTPSGDYLNITGAKVNYEGNVRSNASIRIVPGLSLAAYSSGSGTTQVNESTTNITKGKPNNSASSMNENQLFWRSLRQPQWTNPSLKANITKSGIYLSWNSIRDPYPQDCYSGYLIIRLPAAYRTQATIPIDGKIYNSGDAIGNGTVAANVICSDNTSYLDKVSITCGDSLIYRIYAFRYMKDSDGQDGVPTNARGRSYNENQYDEILVVKKKPQKPIISAIATSICSGDSMTIKSTINGNYKYEWQRNGIPIPDSDIKDIIVKNEGRYNLRIADSLGCFETSDPVLIKVIPFPKANVYIKSKLVTSDTTITICRDDRPVILVPGISEHFWYYNSGFINKKDSIIPDSAGIYYCILRNENLCSDTSFKISVKFYNTNISLQKDTLNYLLDYYKNYDVQTAIISNSSDVPLDIIDIKTSNEYSVVSPLPPFQIPPGKNINLTIRFQPQKEGIYNSQVVLITQCTKKDTIYVFGEKKKATVSLSTTNIDFPLITACAGEFIDSTIRIINGSSESMKIFIPVDADPFYVVSPGFPLDLHSDSSLNLKLRFKSTNMGIYNGVIRIPFEVNNINDTLKINLKGEAVIPAYNVSSNSITFRTLLECEDYIDTSILIRNTGRISISFSSQPIDNQIKYLNLPLNMLPLDSAFLKIRITPAAQGVINSSAEIIAYPCDIKQIISINGKKDGATLNINRDTIDFGYIPDCSLPALIKEKLKFISTLDNKIINIDIPPEITTNLKEGQQIKDTTEAEIYFSPLNKGKYKGKMKITFERCNKTCEINLKAEIVPLSYIIDKTTLDFGINPVNDSISRSFIFKNNSTSVLKIKDITGIQPPFYNNSKNKSYPIFVAPDSSVEFFIDYKQVLISKDTLFVKLEISEPCIIDTLIKLTGETAKIDSETVTISIPKDLSTEHNKIIDLPVYFTGLKTNTISNAQINSLSMQLKFNPTMLQPIDVKLGDDISLSDIQSLDSKEEIPGKMSINILLKCILKDGGNILRIKALALLGNNRTTDLEIDSVKYSAAINIKINTEPGRLTIIDPCSPDNKNIVIGRANSLEINITSAKVRFMINGISDENNALTIYSSLGNELYKEQNLKENVHIEIPISSFNRGVYFAVFRDGINLINKKFLIIN